MFTFTQFGWLSVLTIISVSSDKSELSFTFRLNKSLYSIFLLTTVVLLSPSYEYHIFTSYEPSTPILSPDLYPLNLWVMVFGDNFLPFFKQLDSVVLV